LFEKTQLQFLDTTVIGQFLFPSRTPDYHGPFPLKIGVNAKKKLKKIHYSQNQGNISIN